MGMYLASPWPRQDLFFLDDALRHGGSFAEIASFLCRDEDEVREKAKELKLIGPASVWPFDHDSGCRSRRQVASPPLGPLGTLDAGAMRAANRRLGPRAGFHLTD
jgi:hypothetical protein